MIDILLHTTFFMLPVAGATLFLIKVLFEYIFSWEINREIEAATGATVSQIIVACIAVSLGVLLCIFSTWLLFFPTYKMPEIIKILGIVLYFGFWCTTGMLYRMARTPSSDAADKKKQGVLNKLFIVTADHKIALNPSLNIRNLVNHQDREDPPNSNAA